MTTKTDPLQDALRKERAEEKEAAEGVLLRDESDAIIDNLKRQLEALQGELAGYKSAEAGGRGGAPPPPPRPPVDDDLATWNAALTPHLTRRLQAPAAELTARLERIIEQVDDPDLREELERCRETAFYLFDTFRQISDNHRQLTDSLDDERRVVALADLCRMLEHSRGDAATPLPVAPAVGMPRMLALRSQSLLTISGKLARLAADVRGIGPRGEGLRIELEFHGAPDAPDAELELRMLTKEAWEPLRDTQDVSSVAFRAGATAESVVNLLYVEKIVQLQGGTLAFHVEAGDVHGFTVRVPAGNA